QHSSGDEATAESQPELECKICYNRYDTRSRKPKLLGCLHRVCAKCLKKMVDMGESSPSIISCPFCRHETHVPDEEVRSHFLLFISLSLMTSTQTRPVASLCKALRPSEGGGAAGSGEEASHRSSDCLVITIMELPEESPSSDSLSMLNVVGLYRPPSLDSLQTNATENITSLAEVTSVEPVYFSSLPLGIYLLMIGQLWLGVVLVSLVPSTLLLLVLYGFCQCLCHELMEAFTTRTHSLP
uniref:E3 ubiquitin-protein ligase RNF182 n=1 Tax=Amphilophus citrinellus TaxID=61819 RepID=A0A3Q0SA16_AMPCI